MKYTKQEAKEEIKRRGKRIRRAREKQVKCLLSAGTFLIAVLLFGTISLLTGMGAEEKRSVYASFLLPAEAGIYVLIAFLAFAIGVAITLIIQKNRENDKNSSATLDREAVGKEEED